MLKNQVVVKKIVCHNVKTTVLNVAFGYCDLGNNIVK